MFNVRKAPHFSPHNGLYHHICSKLLRLNNSKSDHINKQSLFPHKNHSRVKWTFQAQTRTYYNTSFEIKSVNSLMLETETLSETLDCYSISKWLITLGNLITITSRKNLMNFWTQAGKSKDQVVHVHAINGYGGFAVQLHRFFTWALDIGSQLTDRVAQRLGNKLAVPVQQ